MVLLHDRRMKGILYHVNMLHKWHSPISTNYFTQEDLDGHEQEEVPLLTKIMEQRTVTELDNLPTEFKDVFKVRPG